MSPRIPSFRDWMARQPQRRDATWLILGKGPSFARLDGLDTRGMLRFGLNHVVREAPVDVFHCIDIEVIGHCGEAIEANAGIAVLPWAPHERRRLLPFSAYEEFLPSGLVLPAYLPRFAVLRRLAEQGRLYWYNLRTAPRRLRRPEAPITPARGFSASAATALLAESGVRHIRTLGIDGGRRYAGRFQDLTETTLLAGGQADYNSQFAALADLRRRCGLDLGPLDHPLPARIRIATSAGEELPAQVLAHDLERHASLSLDIQSVPASATTPTDCLPLLRGDALYLNAASLAETDPRALWTEREAWLPQASDGDGHRTATASNEQPGGGAAHPQAPLICWPPGEPRPWRHLGARDEVAWCETLLDGLRHGAIGPELIHQAVASGAARTSLLAQIARGIADPALLRRRERHADPPPLQPADGYCPARRLRARITRCADRLNWPAWRRRALLVVDKSGKVIRGIGQ